MAIETYFQTQYISPLGTLALTSTDSAITAAVFTDENISETPETKNLPPCLTTCLTQLDEYFNGQRQTFDLPMASAGTPFQEQVWQQLDKISFGKTLSYYDLSIKLGNLGAIRAVGSANGKNKLLLLRPCHRVIGSDGKLVGYAGGLWRKQWLLDHERKVVGTPQLTLFG